MPKPRVLHLITDLEPGGAEKQLLLLLPHLNRHWENHVAYLTGAGSLRHEFSRLAASVTDLQVRRFSTLFGIKPFFRLSRRLRPTMLIGYLIHADLFGRILGSLMRIPSIVSSQRGSLLQWEWLRSLDAATTSLVMRYTTQTEAARTMLSQRLRLPLDRIVVISNAVDTSATSATIQSPPRRLLYVSHLRQRKGHATLFHALASLRRDYPTLTLTLVGDGEQRQALQLLARQLALADAITFTGFAAEPAVHLQQADIAVFPSEAEGMSNALLEAMVAGLPCIASDIPANQALVTDGLTGLLFATGSARSLAQAIRRLFDQPELARHLGATARAYAQAHHQPATIAEQLTNALLP